MAKETEINLEEQALNTIEDEQASDEGAKEESLSADEKKKADEEKPKEPSVEERIADLEKENKGLQGWATAEKKKGQTVKDEAAALKGQLQGIQDVLAESMARREEAATAGKKVETDATTDLIVEISDSDGGAILPGKAFDEAVTAKVKQVLETEGIAANKKNVEELKNQMLFDQEEQARERSFIERRDMLLAEEENEPYSANFPKLEVAYRWFNSKIIRYLTDNRITRTISPGEAIGIAKKEGISEEFTKKYPTLNFKNVVRMYDSDYDFGEALKGLPEGNTNKGKAASIANLKKLADKASNLSSLTNQKSVGGDLTLESIAGMSTEEMEKLSPEDEKKIEKILAGASA